MAAKAADGLEKLHCTYALCSVTLPAAYTCLVNEKTTTNGHANEQDNPNSAKAEDEDSDDDNEDEGGNVEAGATGDTLAPCRL